MKLTLLAGFFLLALSCKSSKSGTATTPEQQNAGVSTAQTQSMTDKDSIKEKDPQQIKRELPDTIRLAVSLISKGEGTDHIAEQDLDTYLSNYFSKTKVKVTYDRLGWGREGEVDFYFNLKELKPEQQKEFIDGLRVTFKDRPLVLVNEYLRNRFRH